MEASRADDDDSSTASTTASTADITADLRASAYTASKNFSISDHDLMALGSDVHVPEIETTEKRVSFSSVRHMSDGSNDVDHHSVNSDYVNQEELRDQEIQELRDSVKSRASFVPEPIEIGTNKGKNDNQLIQRTKSNNFKYKPVTKAEPKATPNPRLGALSMVSKMYDLEGKGYLCEEEQMMRELDTENKGHLSKEQVYEIVKEKMEDELDMKQYKRLMWWMMGVLAMLSVCGLGTSLASATLAKEINTDAETGAVLIKGTQDVVAYDSYGDTLEFSELDDVEYTQRKLQVLKEMEEDEYAEEHSHRRLANKIGGEIIIFDQGKCSERDLEKIVVKCEKGHVVNIQRTWRLTDGTKDVDYDTICGPDFTVIAKKGPRKGNKAKVRVPALEQIVFKKVVAKKGPRKDQEEQTVSFTCNKGDCYASGTILLQAEGHPCNIERGHEECMPGLLCYGGEKVTYGTGVCTRFAKNRKPGQLCDLSYGLKACTGSNICEASPTNRGKSFPSPVYVDGGYIGIGTCSNNVIQLRSKFNQVCDAAYGNDSCLAGYVCMDTKGRVLSSGIGLCGQTKVREINYRQARWYVDYDARPEWRSNHGQGHCVRDCPFGLFNNCGGDGANHEEFYSTWSECCKQKLWWINEDHCVGEWPILE